jgi:hypothetical protein
LPHEELTQCTLANAKSCRCLSPKPCSGLLLPRWQRADQEQKRGQDDGDQRQHRCLPSANRSAEIRSKRKQWPRRSLRRTVAREESVICKPARHYLGLQEWKQHVAAAEHQRSCATEAVEESQRLAEDGGLQERKAIRKPTAQEGFQRLEKKNEPAWPR